MFINKLSKHIFSGLILSCFLIFLQINATGQCGTFFKRVSTTLVPVKGVLYGESADLTGDGIPDLAGQTVDTLQGNGDKLFVLPSNGAGGFDAPIYVDAPSGLSFNNLLVGNFNNDNLRDLVGVFDTSPQSILVYKNNGNGIFSAQMVAAASGEILYLIDINNDGKGDLINKSGNNVMYSFGNGDGTFGVPVQFATNYVLPVDFNSDGRIDFLSGTNLLINQGGGIFSNAGSIVTLNPNEYIREIRDFTGDGKPDILAYTLTSNVKVTFFLNLGNNAFQRTDYPIGTNQPTVSFYGTVFTGNFSGNSSPDIIYRMDSRNQTIVYTNDGAGNFTAQTFEYYLNGNIFGDFDNDGKTDLVRGSDTYNGGSPKLFREVNVTMQKNVCTQSGQPRVSNFGGSNWSGLSFWNPANGKWTGGVSPVFWGLGSLGDIPAPGDFDGDGKTDYAVYRNSTGVWWIRRSSDNAPAAIQFGITGDKPVVGDYDGDSISDIAVWRPSDGNWYILFMGTQQYTIVHWGLDGDKPVPEDYDGDGKTDLAVFRPSTGTWYYLKSSDLNFVALPFGLAADKPVAADYDGDGKADIAVYRDSGNILHILRSSNLSYAAFQFGLSGDIPQPGDYNGDFVFDFGIYRPATQSWYTTISNYQIPFGESSVIPTASILRIE